MARTAGLTLELNNYSQFKRELDNLDKAISSIDNRIDKIGNAFDKMEREAKDAGEQTKQTSKDIDRASKDIENASSRLERASSGFTQVGGALTAGFTLPFSLFAKQGVDAASAFEDALVDIQTRANLTETEIEKIQAKSLDIGRDTQFSAQQGADAFLQLLTSGQDVTEAFQTVDAVMLGAAASGENLGFVSDALTDIMAAFNLEATASEEVLENLVDASGSSSATFSDLVQGFQNVGGVAREFGIDTRETSAILALFAENGIKGAEAGTQLRSMLNNMTRDTEEVQSVWNDLGFSFFNSEGEVRDIADVMGDLTGALDGMTEEDRIKTIKTLAGSFGQLGLSALTSGDSIDDMLAQMELAGDVQDIADAKTKTLSGAFALLKGSVESLQIKAFTPFNDQVIKPFILHLKDITNLISQWVDENPELTQQVLGLGAALAALGPALIVIGQSLTVFDLIGKGLAIITSGPVLLTIGVIALAIHDITNNIGGAGDAFNDFMSSISTLFSTVFGLVGEVSAFFSIFISAGASAERAWSPVTTILRSVQSAIDFITDKLQKVQAVLTLFNATGLSTSVDTLTEKQQNKLLGEREKLMREIAELESDTLTHNDGLTEIFVNQGDTLDSLVDKYGIAQDDLLKLTNGNIIAGQTIEIPVDVELQKLDFLKSRLQEVNNTLNFADSSQLDLLLNQFSKTSVFQRFFGTDDGAIDRAKQVVDDMRIAAGNLTTEITKVKDGFQDLISGNIETGLQKISDGIGGIFSVFSEIGAIFDSRNDSLGQGVISLEERDLFGAQAQGDPFNGFFDNLISGLSKISDDPLIDIAITVLESIRDGITGFITAISGTDTSQFDEAASTIGNALDIMLNALAILGGSLIKSAFDTLPAIGESLSGLFEAVSLVLSGDPEAGIKKFFDAVRNGFDTLVGFPISVVDNIINFFNTVTGLNVPTLSETLKSITTSINQFVDDFINNPQVQQFANSPFVQSFVKIINDLFNGIKGLATGDISIQDIFTPIETAINGFINSKEIQDFIDSPIFDTIMVIVGTFTNFLEGLKGSGDAFIETIDLSLFTNFIQDLLNLPATQVVVKIFTELAKFFTAVAGVVTLGLVDGFGDTLHSFGLAIADLFNTVGNLVSGEGTIEGAVTSFLSLINNLLASFTAIPIGIVDKVIEFFNAATGSDIGSLSGALSTVGDEIKTFFSGIGLGIDSFLIKLEKFVLDIKIKLTEALSSLGVDNGLNVDDLKLNLLNTTLEQQLRDTITSKNGDVGIDVPINVGFDGDTIETNLAQLLSNQTFVDSLNDSTPGLIQQVFDNVSAEDQQFLISLDTIDFDLTNAKPNLVGFGPSLEGEDSSFTDSITGFFETNTESDGVFSSRMAAMQQFALDGGISVGTNMDAGTAQGLNEGTEADLAAQTFADNLIATYKTIWGIESPSTVMQSLGGFLMQGLALGMQESIYLVTNLTQNMENIFTTSITNMESTFVSSSLVISTNSIIMATQFTNQSKRIASGARVMERAISQVTRQVNQLVAALQQVAGFNLTVSGQTVGTGTAEKRYYGGGVSAGQIYEFNERGLPFEIYRTGKSNYMIPNQNGEIISPARAQSLYSPTPSSTSNTVNTSTSSVNYQVTVNIPSSIQNAEDISTDTILEAMEVHQESNPPERRNRGTI